MRWQPFFIMPSPSELVSWRAGAYFNGTQFIANKFVAKKFRARPERISQRIFSQNIFICASSDKLATYVCVCAGARDRDPVLGGRIAFGSCSTCESSRAGELKAKTALKFNLCQPPGK